MLFTPMYDNIIVRAVKAEEKSAGGIIFAKPDSSKPFAEGLVEQVGVGYKTQDGGVVPLKVKVGDRVLYRKGVEIKLNDVGEDLFIFSEGAVIAVRN